MEILADENRNIFSGKGKIDKIFQEVKYFARK